jgi:hypothetical protein
MRGLWERGLGWLKMLRVLSVLRWTLLSCICSIDIAVHTSLTRKRLALGHIHIKSNNTTRSRADTSTMLPSLSFLLVVYIAFSSTVAAHIMLNNPRFIPNQQPLQEPLAVLTTTLHTTVTSYASTSMITATLTRYTADDTTDVPAAVQTWYSAQRAEGCDRTACASCRVWYSCEGFGDVW